MDFSVSNESELAANPSVQSKNGLLYQMPQSLSSSVNKTFIRQQSQRQSYKAGETIVFDLNTGSRYVDPENCVLLMDVVTPDGTFTADSVYTPLKSDIGGIALINEIQVHAKSGVELERIQECNQYAYTRAKLRENSDYWEKWCRMWGGGANIGDQAPVNAQCGSTRTNKIAIPLKVISGLFEPTVKGMKMPPGLISGARVEITLEKFARAFGPFVKPSGDTTSTSATTYSVNNPIIICLAHELSDNSQMVLNEESVENGLEYTYNRVFTDKQPLTSGTVNIQVKKAVAQGLRAFSVPIDSRKVSDQAENGFKSNIGYDNYQFRIGSSYYPQQKVDSAVEGYWTTLNVYNKSPLSSWFNSTLSFDEYAKDGGVVMGAGFETDQRLNLTGVPVNNSATLALEATITPPSASGVTWFTFFEYVAVSRSYLTNVEVKI